jgi:hypothetical protein
MCSDVTGNRLWIGKLEFMYDDMPSATYVKTVGSNPSYTYFIIFAPVVELAYTEVLETSAERSDRSNLSRSTIF